MIDWNYEPCSPEGALSPHDVPWPFATRGRKPGGRTVMGYGYSQPAADSDAREEARRFDAREVLGQPQPPLAIP